MKADEKHFNTSYFTELKNQYPFSIKKRCGSKNIEYTEIEFYNTLDRIEIKQKSSAFMRKKRASRWRGLQVKFQG